ncbi:MAG: hypothetical protein H0T89_18920 [Deltaproteobacteria bacterium]|nr:hypothetical protein [Deltaproteobacteria bacterium]MDQ3300882.1 hypothetical protein [Myxococcota bacterium]
MKRFVILLAVSLVASIGLTSCAHKQLTNRQVANAAVSTALVVGVVVIAVVTDCQDCNLNGAPR